ncbi:MAG: flagellar assembly protein FliH [Candidatus Treponema excrementipullorum]|uniref:Flagellar assembly protein FliH n=1 Tax=Candidatus Treponema excrementipullorum TaxID=2838768 RepID=A0A9E2L234_9SPIR|nr:flagellar assembly protein FliH [Candidatus Treponema excrementipullorum]MCI6479886.1 flagellar assembly protein FliH [Spirochaetia bacterium]MCI6952868.1 flagellar assembly protein FliH [Spirochaetia bacterium]MCI7589638.1 flagellar assembly protein FliH [Spirochaetia bacterium]MDD7013201.1 flagellar assembly protein FliH [Candidatus Treponema excrementipullorum]
MAKTVFRPNEIKACSGSVMLKLPVNFEPEVEEVEAEPVEVYEGPTVEELRKEAEEYKVQWEAEKQSLLDKAQAEAKEIVAKAEQAAFDEVKRQTDQAQVAKTNAEAEAADVLKKANEEAAAIIAQAQEEKQKIHDEAYKTGFDEGREKGYEEGNLEAQRLIDRLHVILDRIMDKRQEILDNTEQQIVELVLLMARKVVKVISENQRNVVMSNVLQALRKVKGRGDVIVRVNLADVKLTTEHTKDFMRAVENIQNITVAEDSSIDRGGCIIETDFGAIDARISSQLAELEQKILEISPIKTVAKSSGTES